MCLKLRHAKFQRCSAGKTFLNFGLNGGGRKMKEVEKCAFSTENWPYLGNSERYGQGYYQSLIESSIRSVT